MKLIKVKIQRIKRFNEKNSIVEHLIDGPEGPYVEIQRGEDATTNSFFKTEPQQLFFTTDEEIKKGDLIYAYNPVIGKEIARVYKIEGEMVHYNSGGYSRNIKFCRKIIATTEDIPLNKNVGTPVSNGTPYGTKMIYKPTELFSKPSKDFMDKYIELNGINEIIVECYDDGRIVRDKHNVITIHPFKKQWSKEELEYELRNILFSSPDMIETNPDGTVNCINEEEFKKYVNSKV